MSSFVSQGEGMPESHEGSVYVCQIGAKPECVKIQILDAGREESHSIYEWD